MMLRVTDILLILLIIFFGLHWQKDLFFQITGVETSPEIPLCDLRAPLPPPELLPFVDCPPPPDAGAVFCRTYELPYLAVCSDVEDRNERKRCSDQKLLAFILTNLVLPAGCRELGCSNMLVVTFIIETSGEVSGVKIVRSANPMLDAELLRIVQMLPRFVPGNRCGKAVPHQFHLPIRIRTE